MARDGDDDGSAASAALAKAKGVRTFLTNAQKIQLRDFWAANAQLHVQEVADWVRRHFGASVGRATLYRIGRAPASAFEGQRGSRKKSRRVKFPELERDVLAFCLACKDQRRALPDDLLLQQAAELRARHGISSDALKLSNGWLHSFKERHALRIAVHATGDASAANNPSSAVPVVVEPTSTVPGVVEPTSAVDPVVPPVPAIKPAQQTSTPIDQATTQPQTEEAPPVAPPLVATQPQADVQRRVVTPLTYIAVKALSSVQAVSFLNWERVGGKRDSDLFDVVDDGVCVSQGGKYQINADISYSPAAQGEDDASTVFKVWRDTSELLGESSARLPQENGVSWSAVQLQASLPANAVVQVQFVAPGFALHTSRLVIKLVTASHGADPPSTTPTL